MPRFAVLRHESPEEVHWDFLVETGAALRTWALPQAPAADVEMTCHARKTGGLSKIEILYYGQKNGTVRKRLIASPQKFEESFDVGIDED